MRATLLQIACKRLDVVLRGGFFDDTTRHRSLTAEFCKPVTTTALHGTSDLESFEIIRRENPMETMETPKGDTRPPTMPGTSGRRRLTAALLIASLAAAVAVAPAHAADDGKRARADIVREWNEDGSASSGDEVVGRSWLRRSADGLDAMAVVHGLRPGGVYTFWWVVVQDDGDFPADIHVQRAAGTVVKNGGNVRVSMTAQTGDAGIQGFPPLGGALFADLTDPLGSLVRLEIAYHGQAEDAGGDLDVWLSDFWSGTACPPETPNPNPAQPHCPVYFASTHAP